MSVREAPASGQSPIWFVANERAVDHIGLAVLDVARSMRPNGDNWMPERTGRQ